MSVSWVSIGSDNGLSPLQCQAIIWTNVGILLMGPIGTNFSEIRIKIQNFYSWKCISQCCLQNGGHFIQGEMSYSWFQCLKLMVAPGDPKTGLDQLNLTLNYNGLHNEGNFLNISGQLRENLSLKHCYSPENIMKMFNKVSRNIMAVWMLTCGHESHHKYNLIL